jgi:hypothetical protein
MFHLTRFKIPDKYVAVEIARNNVDSIRTDRNALGGKSLVLPDFVV